VRPSTACPTCTSGSESVGARPTSIRFRCYRDGGRRRRQRRPRRLLRRCPRRLLLPRPCRLRRPRPLPLPIQHPRRSRLPRRGLWHCRRPMTRASRSRGLGVHVRLEAAAGAQRLGAAPDPTKNMRVACARENRRCASMSRRLAVWRYRPIRRFTPRRAGSAAPSRHLLDPIRAWAVDGQSTASRLTSVVRSSRHSGERRIGKRPRPMRCRALPGPS
jgi:hypothetical protein